MARREVNTLTILQNLIPNFVQENYSLVQEFLKCYYISLINEGNLRNLDWDLTLNRLSKSYSTTELFEDISFYETSISVKSTEEFPNQYGLIQIDSEIILYEYKTPTSFENCVRGFSGITAHEETQLVFEESIAEEHSANTEIRNLNEEFLKLFFEKFKYEYAPQFDFFDSNLNQNVFIQRIRDFYSSKGTHESFRVLFLALYNEAIQVINPIQYVFRTSDSEYRITQDLVIEMISGNAENLLLNTIFQNRPDDSICYGTVTNIKQILQENRVYYQLSLDYDYDKDIDVRGTLFGQFEITPSTQILNVGENYLDVDSTLGFPESGELVYNNSILTYSNKNLTQFLNCNFNSVSNLKSNTLIQSNSFYGYTDDSLNRFRITGVLSNLKTNSKSSEFNVNDSIQILHLGKLSSNSQANHWIWNCSNLYHILRFKTSDSLTYEIELYDDHLFRLNDTGILQTSATEISEFQVIRVISPKNLVISLNQSFIPNDTTSYYLKRNLSKFNSKYFENASIYSTDVQNVYFEENGVYISATSLPSYDQKTEIQRLEIEFEVSAGVGTTNILNTKVPHSFLTGDEVIVSNSILEFQSVQNLPFQIYFVKVISDRSLKLAPSLDVLYQNQNSQYISFSSTNSAYLIPNRFEFRDLQAQNEIRKLSAPQSGTSFDETSFNTIGMFINGVEIQNYKSTKGFNYGQIEKIDVNDFGSQYDVIQVPSLVIDDSSGTGIGASANVCVKGGLSHFYIQEPGFDYQNLPQIQISGGNGKNCDFSVQLRKVSHIETFNSSIIGQTLLNLGSGIIQFPKNHKFRKIEKVIYRTNSQTALGNLFSNAEYWIFAISANQIQLYSNENDCKRQISPISINSFGQGIHSFEAIEKKNTIDNISVLNSGENYTNQKTTIHSSQIDVNLNTFYFKDHNFKTDELVVYTPETAPVAGLGTSSSYLIQKIDENLFKLKNSITKTEVDLIGITTNTYHHLNYEPISLTIKYQSQTAFNSYPPQIEPIFTGGIHQINLISGGSNYGSSEIINYDRQPILKLVSGSGATVFPIIENGKIIQVQVATQGSNYKSIPNIQITGPGYGAILTPVIQNGKLTSVKVINSGVGYDSNRTQIKIQSRGFGSILSARIQRWTFDQVYLLRKFSQISLDEGVLFSNSNSYSYTHLYCPRSLRASVFAKFNDSNGTRYKYDLENDSNLINADRTKYHSPILGWAYDGNPIYGPYGFVNNQISRLQSGYKLIPSSSNRPLNFELGSFVEDYVYNRQENTLDEHNGRYCVTPEFPNGTYAYFVAISESGTPVFPYLIGNTYYSKYISQKNHFIRSNMIRNTLPYDSLKTHTKTLHYDVKNLNSFGIAQVSSISSGKIDSVQILNSGEKYRIGDSVKFKSSDSIEKSYLISEIQGKEISSIVGIQSTINFVQIQGQNFICSSPHNFSNRDQIYVEYDRQNHIIDVIPNQLKLISAVQSSANTGIVTYLSVAGNLNFIQSDDIYTLDSEKIQVLNVDSSNSRIRVLREAGGTSHTSNSTLNENSRRFKIANLSSQNTIANRKIYFNSQESLGLGRTFGVGIQSTIYFSNSGSGKTYVEIPTRTVYLPNHSISNSAVAIYSNCQNTGITVSSNGVDDFVLTDQSKIYLTRISNDLIGISTVRVGLNTSGQYVGIGTSGSLLYLINSGTGNYHSFEIQSDSQLLTSVSKNYARVITKEPHNLQNSDFVTVSAISNQTQTYQIKYNFQNKRLTNRTLNFVSGDIDLIRNTIRIVNHNLNSGDKVIYEATTASIGLTSNQIYYVLRVNSNEISLTNTKLSSVPIDIQSAEAGSISLINSQIYAVKNSKLSFDVSDSSLGSGTFPAFDLRFYTDSEFRYEYSNSIFDVTRTGTLGINTDAKIELNINENTPETLYYNLIPINLEFIRPEQRNIYSDQENIQNSHQITLVSSAYAGRYSVSGIGSTTFNYNLNQTPEVFNSSNYDLSYVTESKTALGGISKLNLKSISNSYKILPGVSSITSNEGNSAILYAESSKIGQIQNVQIQNIGFDYCSDLTLRPSAAIPQILKIDPLNSLKFIEIESYGIGYSLYPDLILIDSFTNQVVSDVQLKMTSNSEVQILKNTKGIYNITPKLIPIHNSNGVGISSISYQSNSNTVTVTLNQIYSSSQEFPFKVGDKVLIENVRVLEFNKVNYNSSDFNYELFEVNSVTPNYGVGFGTFTYIKSANFGSYDNSTISLARAIPERNFPKFKIELQKNVFNVGEIVKSENDSIGYVVNYNEANQKLKILTRSDFKSNTLIVGNSSKSIGLIQNIIEFEGYFDVNATSVVNRGWAIDYLGTSNSIQKLHDNDYYQYFSYEIQSTLSNSVWDSAVSTLNHPSGFKRFSRLSINSESEPLISNEVESSKIIPIKYIIGEAELSCSYDFDLASENNYNGVSNEINFNSQILQDYSESVGNRVLKIDDISDQFDSRYNLNVVNSFRI